MLSILIPDSLLSLPTGRTVPDRERASFAPPATFQRLMARGRWSDFSGCEGDPLEQAVYAWLLETLTAGLPTGGVVSAAEVSAAEVRDLPLRAPPPWAMLPLHEADAVDGTAGLVDDLRPTPFTRWWVSPVHVRIGRDGVSLVPPDGLDLTRDEALAFNETLLAVTTDAGWQAVRGGDDVPARGILMDASSPLMQAIPSPWAMARQRFTDLLPAGTGMADWRRLWMDVQMALHTHPVNQQRQQRGALPVNAFWWWGGGEAWPEFAGLRIRARVTDLATGSVDAVALRQDSAHRLAAWLGALLPGQPDVAEQARSNSSMNPGRQVDSHDIAQAALHLIDNAHAGLWFAPGSEHPIVRGLDEQIMAPLAMAAAPHRLVLTGQAGWRTVESTAALRWAVWKNRARVDDIVEPVAGLLDEGDLARAWQDSAARATPDDGEFHPDRF